MRGYSYKTSDISLQDFPFTRFLVPQLFSILLLEFRNLRINKAFMLKFDMAQDKSTAMRDKFEDFKSTHK